MDEEMVEVFHREGKLVVRTWRSGRMRLCK